MKYLYVLLILTLCTAIIWAQRNTNLEIKQLWDGSQINFSDHPEWSFSAVNGKNENTRFSPEPSAFPQPEKLFILSDIEGEFEPLRSMLIANKIIDSQYNWIYQRGHLVIDGDLFDRGKQVPECLWLLYKLDKQARKKGGYVHIILGNHDLMNFAGDLRYVAPKYFEQARILNTTYTKFFGPSTRLGAWLRSKNVIEKIGRSLFLHAGISPEINSLGWSLEKINSSSRAYYGIKEKQIPDSIRVLFADNSPVWYRGYFLSPRADTAVINTSLSIYDADQIIVGHTILERNIAMYYDGKVIGIDRDVHQSEPAALVYEKGKWYIANNSGNLKRLKYIQKNDIIIDKDIL